MRALSIITAAIVGLTFGASAKTPDPTQSPGASTPPVTAPATPKVPKAPRLVLPMHNKVDAIDAAAKTFSYTTKAGKKVVNKVTGNTTIMQGDKPAQFSDVKVGDTISGSHKKISATEYEIIKITKFGIPVAKEKKVAKEVEKAA